MYNKFKIKKQQIKHKKNNLKGQMKMMMFKDGEIINHVKQYSHKWSTYNKKKVLKEYKEAARILEIGIKRDKGGVTNGSC